MRERGRPLISLRVILACACMVLGAVTAAATPRQDTGVVTAPARAAHSCSCSEHAARCTISGTFAPAQHVACPAPAALAAPPLPPSLAVPSPPPLAPRAPCRLYLAKRALLL